MCLARSSITSYDYILWLVSHWDDCISWLVSHWYDCISWLVSYWYDCISWLVSHWDGLNLVTRESRRRLHLVTRVSHWYDYISWLMSLRRLHFVTSESLIRLHLVTRELLIRLHLVTRESLRRLVIDCSVTFGDPLWSVHCMRLFSNIFFLLCKFYNLILIKFRIK